MLIETQIKPNDIVSLKLINGEEIIAKVVDNEGLTITVTKPLTLMLGRDPKTGNPGIQMAPIWFLGADIDQKFPIMKSNIVCMVKSSPEAVKGYAAQTSGLAIPSNSGGGLFA